MSDTATNITISSFMELPNAHVENARVERISVGSNYHDGRGFFTVMFEGGSWGQGCNPKWDRETIDRLISVCGRQELFGCLNAPVRIGRIGRGTASMICIVAPLIKDDPVLVLRPDLIAEALRVA